MMHVGGTLQTPSKGIKDMAAKENNLVTWNGQKTVFSPFSLATELNNRVCPYVIGFIVEKS